MSPVNQYVFTAALSLPPASRAELAELLWASLPEEPADSPLDEEVKAAWLAEAARRMKEVEEGKVQLISGEDVLQRLRTKSKP